MANPFREMSLFMQILVAVALAVVLVLAGEFVPVSPVQQVRDRLEKAQRERQDLNREVISLQVYKQRYGELKQQMNALQKQLATLQAIVPEEKEVDEFIRLLQGQATASNVQIRRLTAQAVVPKEYHYEMPFEVQVDGPYFNILDFFGRLSRLSRIINIGDLQFDDPEKAKGAKYPMRPGTTVSGTFIAVTFFTKAAEPAPAGAPGKAPAKAPGRP
jgi:type IV pilus assembly protein PilO